MKVIKEFGIIALICWVSKVIETILPFAFPASVIGLVVLLILLLVKAVKMEHIESVSSFLTGNLPFLFVPAVVSIMNYTDVIAANLIPFVVICMVSMVITFAATAYAVTLTMKLMNKKGDQKK